MWLMEAVGIAANMLFSPVLWANPLQFSTFEIALTLLFTDT
jgi:hypothetical protein